jgi:hypothetical protein
MQDKVQRLPAGARTAPLPAGTSAILAGGGGEPPLLVRDHGVWEQQAAEERRETQDAEIKALVGEIEAAEQTRRYARPVALEELRTATTANRALLEHRRQEAARPFAELAELERDVSAMLAQLPPEPPQRTRYGRPLSTAELAHEAQLAEAFAARMAGGR